MNRHLTPPARLLTPPEPVRPYLPCPMCGGPPLHPGACVDRDGEVRPAYAELALLWEEQGRPEMPAEELIDLEEMIDVWGVEEERPR